MGASLDSTLGDPQHIIAELQRQLVECRAERDEALQRENATAEVLQVINSSPGDLTPVFDAILEKAHSLCGVQYGVLLTYDGELFWPVAMRGAPPTWELIGAEDAWCHLGDALDLGAHLRVHCLAGEEALTFICEERCSRRQHHPDPQRGDTVEAWHFEYFGKRDADQRDD